MKHTEGELMSFSRRVGKSTLVQQPGKQDRLNRVNFQV